jgi:cardiolipin synthase C
MQQMAGSGYPKTANPHISGHSSIIALCVFAILLLQGCATSLPPQVERAVSDGFDRPAETRLGQRAALAARSHPGESGLFIQDTGRQAFLQRAALIEAAERSIDAQYYIWNSDVSGRYLALRLLRAADRGVRVRLLLDDVNVAGRDAVIAALDSHANIEIRIYNPFATREGFGRVVEALADFRRINRRMHNKTFVVDGAFGMVGGRNIGDEYFGMHPLVNFRDRDVLAVGPVVRDMTANFDIYWNSPAAYPIAVLAGAAWEPDALQRSMAEARADAGDTRDLLYKPVQEADAALADAQRWLDELEWAPAELIFSEPVTEILPEDDKPSRAAVRIGELMAASQREILMESAYFILGDTQLAGIRQLSDRGVKIRAITNSLASNDLVGNHAGYARGRKGMLASGIELHELKPDAKACAQWVVADDGCPGAVSLHSKSMVFDRSILYVGSFNLNLRSIYLNGETVLIVHSPRLAATVAQAIDEAMQPDNSWHVTADGNGALQWTGSDGVYTHEPATGGWRRFKAGLFGLLPIEKYY